MFARAGFLWLTAVLFCAVFFTSGTPSIARADETSVDLSTQAQARRGVVARTAYGVGMSAVGVALVPIATESVIRGDLESIESGGFFVSAAILGFGGIPLIAQANTSITGDPLSGPRARVRLAKDGVGAYAFLGGFFSCLSLVTGAVVIADTATLPPSILLFNASSFTMLATAVGLAADGDRARLALPVGDRRKPFVGTLAAPLMVSGIILLTVATPVTRLMLHQGGKNLDPSLMPMVGGASLLTLGVTSLILSRTINAPSAVAGRAAATAPRVGLDLRPDEGLYGLVVQGRF